MKQTDTKWLKIVNCPGCNSKTISYWLAYKEAQTCKNCGRAFKVKRSKLIETFLTFSIVLVMVAGEYLSRTYELKKLFIYGLAGSFLLSLIIYQLWPKKLIEIKS